MASYTFLGDVLLEFMVAVLAILVPFVVGVIGYWVRAWLAARVATEEMRQIMADTETKERWARQAALMAQQLYADCDGPAKYARAAEWISRRLENVGLRWTPDEIEGLIEGTLKQLKAEFGCEWDKIKNETLQDAAGGANGTD